jgi:hypothetical protein
LQYAQQTLLDLNKQSIAAENTFLVFAEQSEQVFAERQLNRLKLSEQQTEFGFANLESVSSNDMKF